MTEIAHRYIETNGIRMHLAEKGSGPLVVLCHGFPESWYSWRHQIDALAAAGFHVVAPDMRGYGQTDAPEAIEDYTLLHLVGDMVGVLDALGEATAVIAGHDWGAPVAWHAALLRPDRFRAVIGLSVPYRPRGKPRPTTVMRRTEDAVFAGDRDLVLAFPGAKEMVTNLPVVVPQLRQTIVLPGCGHWTQQERAAEVNAAMTAFLREL